MKKLTVQIENDKVKFIAKFVAPDCGFINFSNSPLTIYGELNIDDINVLIEQLKLAREHILKQ